MTKPVDFTKPVQTRDGVPVRIYATDGAGDYPVHGAMGGHLYTWTLEGRWHLMENRTHPRDLVNVPEKQTRWVNFYNDGVSSHHSKVLADSYAAIERIACIKVEYIEGEGL